MPPKMPQRDEPGAVHQQRRQEDHEHQLRVERDHRQARQKGEQRASGQQSDGRRQAQPVGRIMQDDDRQQHHDHQFEHLHRVHILPLPSGLDSRWRTPDQAGGDQDPYEKRHSPSRKAIYAINAWSGPAP